LLLVVGQVEVLGLLAMELVAEEPEACLRDFLA
jgi:hypothetical protein